MKNTLFFLFILLLIACRKERVTTNSTFLLTASADTVRFDTAFTGIGSVTQTVKVFNENEEGIRISSIRLMGGAASPFRINGNGIPGPLIENLEIAAQDSAYVFITATTPPSSATAPFLVQDSIEINYNNNKKVMQLEAYGQNAHFLRRHTITGTEVWNADLPYVVLGEFKIAKDAHLTITEGCKIYLHADAAFFIDGTLTVQGKHWDSTKVLFTGDRLGAPYRDLPGSWPGLVFRTGSSGNALQHAIIKNAYQAVVVEASPLLDKLRLNETIIENAYDAGIQATNTNINTRNLLVSNCGKNIVLQGGGNYEFTHATVASFSTPYLPHKSPVLTISADAELNAVFRNCIFWGESGGVVKDEVVLNASGPAPFHVLFDGVLWPLASPPAEATLATQPLTIEPEFRAISPEEKLYDFHLKETSPAINSGVPSSVSLDLDGRPRPVGIPDLGAYENQ